MVDLVCRTITDAHAIAGLTDAWRKLAQSAVESNPFYGPSFLLPLLEECGWPTGLEIWVVAPRSDPSQIVGLFPFHRRRFGPGELLHVIAPFTRGRHGAREIDIDLGLPLIDNSCVDAVLDALLDRLHKTWWPFTAIEWFGVPGDGAFFRALQARLIARGQPTLNLGGWERALFRPAADPANFLAEVVSKRRSKDLAQSRRQIERSGGPLSFEVLAHDADPLPWIAAYVGMEAGGWKGSEGTDIGATPGGLRFFTRSLCEMHAEGLAVAYQLSAGGIPIAQTWLLTGADGNVAMAWKMAYDDTYRKMSPGLLMQIDALGVLHGRALPLREIDSCAAPNHPMWSWFWPGRRRLQHLIVAPRGPLNALVVRVAVSVRNWRHRKAAARVGAQEQGVET